MQKTKRLFAMLMVIAMMLTLLPVMASAVTMTGGEKLYLKPNSNWTQAGARFAAYFCNGSSAATWVSMTDSDGDGIYEVTVPNGNHNNVIFCRMDPSFSTNSWDTRWNQTSDLTYDGTKNCYTVASGTWDKGGGTWSTYTPVVPTAALAGTLSSWEATAEDNQMTIENGIATKTLALDAGTYEFKIVKNGSTWLGYNGSIADATTTDLVMTDTSNCKLTATGGTYTFNFNMVTNKLSITHVPAEPDPSEPSEPGETEPIEPPVTEPTTHQITVYYHDAHLWKNVNLYAWDASGPIYSDPWPGYSMTAVEEHENWFKAVLELPFELDTVNMIFNDGARQTADLSCSGLASQEDFAIYYADEKFTSEAPDKWENGAVDPIESKPIYFLPNFNWIGGDAAFAAYFFNDTASQWVAMTDENGDGVYEAAVPEGMTTVIFCRMDPAAAEPSWESKWNQSDDMVIPTDGTDLYIMDQGVWGKDTENPWAGAWNTYVETTVPEIVSPVITGNSVTFNYWHYAASSVSVHGSMSRDDWNTAYEMTKGENGVWSVTINELANGEYQYKLVVDDCWILDPANSNIVTEADNNQNSVFSVGTPVAEIYDVGVYFTFEDAYAAVDSASGHVIALLTDVNIDGLAVDKELNLDLNGHNATFTNTTGDQMIWVQDSATVNCETTQWGTLITDANYDCLGGYVMLPETEGHSFHSYNVEITHISLAPNSDALGYKATVTGDSAVLNAVTGFGFNMSVAGGQVKTFTTEPGENFDGTFTLRLKNILANGGGEMEITASAFVIFGEEQSVDSEQQTTTMKQTLQAVDAAWETADYTTEQKDAVKDLCTKYYDDIQNWGLENIFPVIDIPITQ